MSRENALSKVPAVTLTFWIIKILATTLGETGGDSVTMTWLGETTAHPNPNGYLIGTAIFFAALVVLVILQIVAKTFHPLLYWATIVASTTAGTTLADFADRSLGIGYVGGSLLLFALLMLVLGLWRYALGSVSVDHIDSPKVELFYWTTILFSNTLGTALGDFLADDSGLGFAGGALVFAAVLALIAAAYFLTRASRTLLFWSAFILTRPLGATLGDLLTKPHADGGFNLSRIDSASVIAAFIVGCILIFTSARAGDHPAAQRVRD